MIHAFRMLCILASLLIAAPAAAVTLATDNFTGSDANPIAGNWTTIGGGLAAIQRVGNAAQGTNTGATSGAYYNAVSAPNDQWSSVKITAATASSSCALVRVAASANTYYGTCLFSSGTAIDLFKTVAGTYTSLSAVATTWSVGDTIKTEVQGTALKAFINAVEITSASDASLTSGQFGIAIPGTSPLSNMVADDWSGGDFTSASAPRRRVIVVD